MENRGHSPPDAATDTGAGNRNETYSTGTARDSSRNTTSCITAACAVCAFATNECSAFIPCSKAGADSRTRSYRRNSPAARPRSSGATSGPGATHSAPPGRRHTAEISATALDTRRAKTREEGDPPAEEANCLQQQPA